MTALREYVVRVGPYRATPEVPEPWLHPWRDADGNPIDLAAFELTATVRLGRSGTPSTREVIPGPDVGDTVVVWQAGDMVTPGLYGGEVIATNPTNTLAQSFRLLVLAPLGGALEDA